MVGRVVGQMVGQWLELVKRGYSYREVGRELGISHGKVGCIMESNEVAESLHGDLLKKREEIGKLRERKEKCEEISREAERLTEEKMRRVEELLAKEQDLVEAIRGFAMKREYYEEKYKEVKRLEEDAQWELLGLSKAIQEKRKD